MKARTRDIANITFRYSVVVSMFKTGDEHYRARAIYKFLSDFGETAGTGALRSSLKYMVAQGILDIVDEKPFFGGTEKVYGLNPIFRAQRDAGLKSYREFQKADGASTVRDIIGKEPQIVQKSILVLKPKDGRPIEDYEPGEVQDVILATRKFVSGKDTKGWIVSDVHFTNIEELREWLNE